MIEAITNQQIGLKYHILPNFVGFFVSIFAFSSVISELIIGYALPGRPVAMMLFKTWGYITMTQGLRSLFPCSVQLSDVEGGF